MINILAGGFKHLLFSIEYGLILPIDYFFQDGYCTTNQTNYNML